MTKKEFDSAMAELAQEWNNITLMKFFEITVLNKETHEIEHLLYKIHLDRKNHTLWCNGVAKLIEEELDSNYSLDNHLEELLAACYTDITDTAKYDLVF